MKKIYKYLMLVILFCSISTLGISQATYKQYFEKGLSAMGSQNFSAAMVYFNDAYDKDDENYEALYYYANAARQQFAYTEAEYAFQKLVEETDNSTFPKAAYYLASIKHQLGKYNDAIHYYDLYLSENFGVDEMLTEKSLFAKECCEWAKNESAESTSNPAIVMSNDINSPYSEHAPVWHNGQLEYASLRFPKAKDKLNRLISKIIYSDSLDIENSSNEIYNSDQFLTSNTSYSKDGRLQFFTKCDYPEIGDIKCEIYYRNLDPDDKWGNAIKLPQAINALFSTNTQVSVRQDQDDNQILYFVSDRSGGKGGMDIWSSRFDAQMNFQEPENLEINTAYDDITPYFDLDEQALYFSSNGRLGFGGFDVYKLEDRVVENLGAAINTSFNEIYYTIGNDGKQAYFSSNRPGSQYLDEKFETCCYDIYQTELDKCIINLQTLTFDEQSRSAIENVAIELVDGNGNAYSSSMTTGNKNDFKVPCNEDLKIHVSKDGYLPLEVNLSDLKDFQKEMLYLEKSPIELRILVFDESNKSELINTKMDLLDQKSGLLTQNINTRSNEYLVKVAAGKNYQVIINKSGYTDKSISVMVDDDVSGHLERIVYLNKANLQLMVSTFERATKTKLKEVQIIVEDTNGNQIFSEITGTNGTMSTGLSPGKSYVIKAIKQGYELESKTINVSTNKTGQVSQDVYLGRVAEIASLNNLIPLKLYFNNDSPDPSTMRTTTQKHYEEIFFPYYFQKKRFKSVYGSKFHGEKSVVAVEEVERFFEQDLKGGYDQLSIFMETLDRVLQSGKKVNLYLRGYASPVAQSTYNNALGKRRVDCIRNEFEKYESGKLLEYMSTGQLKITERSFGENQSSTNVSDDPYSPAASIFSPQASRERRIEIDEIKEVN